MAVRSYTGTARPTDSRFEGNPRYRTVEWDHADASIIRGYQKISSDGDSLPVGALVSGCTMVVSPARQAALDAANAAAAAEKAQDAAFLADLETLATAVRDNTATQAQTRRCIWKLFRAYKGLLRDQ